MKADDKLLLANGKQVAIDKIEIENLAEFETTYNFEVADFHTYYVTEGNVLVHNRCGQLETTELSDDALLNFGEAGRNKGFRVINGSHDDAMNFVRSQTQSLVEYAPGKFVGYNSRGVAFRVYARPVVPAPYTAYTSIRITGVKGLNGIKFIWP